MTGFHGEFEGTGEVFATSTAGLFDGFRLDTQERLWTSTAEDVRSFAPDGTLIGRICVAEIVSNLVFGGARRNRLFICGTTSLYAAYVNANGCTPG